MAYQERKQNSTWFSFCCIRQNTKPVSINCELPGPQNQSSSPMSASQRKNSLLPYLGSEKLPIVYKFSKMDQYRSLSANPSPRRVIIRNTQQTENQQCGHKRSPASQMVTLSAKPYHWSTNKHHPQQNRCLSAVSGANISSRKVMQKIILTRPNSGIKMVTISEELEESGCTNGDYRIENKTKSPMRENLKLLPVSKPLDPFWCTHGPLPAVYNSSSEDKRTKKTIFRFLGAELASSNRNT